MVDEYIDSLLAKSAGQTWLWLFYGFESSTFFQDSAAVVEKMQQGEACISRLKKKLQIQSQQSAGQCKVFDLCRLFNKDTECESCKFHAAPAENCSPRMWCK